MSTTTAKLGLIKPELSDPADITALNVNWDTLDTEITKKVGIGDDGKIPSELLPELPEMSDYVKASEKGKPNGIATLGEDAKVPAEQLPEISSAKSHSVVLYNYSWKKGSDDRYAQTVTVPDVTADSEIVVVDVDLSTDDLDAKVAYLEAWQHPSANEVDQGDGTLTFYSYESLTVNIPISVGVM